MDTPDYSSWVELLILGAVALLLWRRYGYQSKKAMNLPPGPLNLPIIGAFLHMETRMHSCFERLAKKYGPVVYLRLGVQNVVLVSSAESAEEVLRHKDLQFADRANAMSRTAGNIIGFESAVFPFANYDSQLKLLRKISMVEFFTGAKLKSYEELRRREAAAMVEKIFSDVEIAKQNADSGSSTHSAVAMVDMKETLRKESENLIFTLCFGQRFDGMSPTDILQGFGPIMDDFIRLMTLSPVADLFPLLRWMELPGLMKDMKSVGKRQQQFFERILEEHRRNRKLKSNNVDQVDQGSSSTRNFVDVMLQIQEEGGDITDNGIMALLLSILAAGIETSATAVEWMMLELVRHPAMQARLHAELDAVVGKERIVEESDLEAMPFLNALVTESLRLHPPVTFTPSHVTLTPSALCGYNIPANTAAIVNIYSIGRDPKFWKDPLEFKPDRFMPGGSSADSSSSGMMKVSGTNYHLLPFSSGRRNCVGFSLAMVMILRTLATLLHAFDWSPTPGKTAEDITTDDEGSFVIHPSPLLVLTPTPRLPSHIYRSGLNL